jgi:iron complex outermembrane recepter protein
VISHIFDQSNRNSIWGEKMKSVTTIRRLGLVAVISSIISPLFLFPLTAQAQTLEEIVVTAQRREQSIQEVPISLEAYTGALLDKEGFRAMEDLSNFSPSVEIDIRVQDQDIAIRGLGTTGNNLGLEQAVPTFSDGVHFGRTSMIMGAFLDLERVEVLRGPQPIAFGQNATAGAFSLTSKKPTPEWEANVTAEYGNWNRFSLEGGVGGPITDTWGIRVAGQHDRLGGYITDVVTGEKFPSGEESAGRITLAWTPTENFGATLKAEWAQRRRKGGGNAVCLTDGVEEQTERAVTIPHRTGFADDIVRVLRYPKCGGTFKRIGIREGQDTFFRPIHGIDQEDGGAGIVDITQISASLMDRNDTHDNMDAYNYRLGLSYEFTNGISVDSTTAMVDYQRSSVYDNSSSPIVTNLQHRGEIYDMFSQEIRLLSPRGGTIEWEAGVFYQDEDLDLGNIGNPKYQTVSIRANTRRAYRTQDNWQDTRWASAFASFTFNFLDDRASLDVGARYTDVSKQSYIQGFAAQWIYDIDPDANDAGGADGVVEAYEHDRDRLKDVSRNVIDCGDLTDPRRRTCGDFMAGFWTMEFNQPNGGSRRGVPDAWDTLEPFALGPVLWGIRDPNENEIYFRDFKDDRLDPQVTLRYRPSDTLSLYAKWVRAFKAGGADISSGSLPDSQELFLLKTEKAESYEIGAKGSLLDGAAQYNISFFNIEITDLQIATNTPTVDTGTTQLSGSRSTNASQRTRGMEFDARWAATDRLTLGVSGAIMDGIMTDFKGAGCTNIEAEFADTGPCLSEDEAQQLEDDGVVADAGDVEFTIDRTGEKAPRTPDWKFVFDVNWWYPIGDRHKYMFSTKIAWSDDYIWNVEDFDKVISYNQRVTANLNVGFGDMEDTWNVTFWGRNLFEAGLEYNPEFDFDDNRQRADNQMSPRNWFSYGVQFQYNYN